MVGRKIAKALFEATQQTIEKWFQQIDTAITLKSQRLIEYEQKKKKILPKLVEATEKGVSLRELSKILGIPHQTLAKWLNEYKSSQEQPQHG
jgi:transposase-like protein